MRRPWLFLFYLFIFQAVFAQMPASELPAEASVSAAADQNPAETISSTLILEGEVFYLPRLALPQDAELLLTLNDFSELPQLLQQQRLPLHGKQVPIAFRWPIRLEARLPNLATFQAAIINSNKIIWMSEVRPLVLMPGQQYLGELKLTAANLPPLTMELYCGKEKFHLKAEAGQQLLAVGHAKHSALNFALLAPLPSALGRRFFLAEQRALTEHHGEFFLQSASGRSPCLNVAQLPALNFAEAAIKVEIFQGDFLLTLKEAVDDGQALYLSPIHSVQTLVSENEKPAALFFNSELFDLWYYPEACSEAKPGNRITVRLTNSDLAEKIGSEKTFCAEASKPNDTKPQ